MKRFPLTALAIALRATLSLRLCRGLLLERSGTLFADPTLRILRDLMRVAPVEQYFAIGYTDGEIDKHGDIAIYDGFDNNMDGHTDNMVSNARNVDGYTAPQLPNGHFMGDRAVVGRMNINELAHPAAIWYASVSNGNSRT